ncbi:MAG TPA: diacylglycerol kinase family protein [Candidatus Kapabacteria bacterium]|nr:diacylglycerol kinase family protein [Candidatus Kapabacteria bacterium]
MYVYLYDHFLRQKKFEPTIRAMETRLTDYGIAGKIIRLQSFTNAEAVVEEEKKKGATTVVIVGNDATFGQVVSRAATCDILFGFLPLGGDNTIADVLGIPVGETSCDVLARRRRVFLDVGWFNNRYFISQLHIPPSPITVTYDERFTVSSQNGKIELVVCNLQPFIWKEGKKDAFVVHPQDGKLEAFLRPMTKKGWFREVYEEPSIFPFEEMMVQSKTPFLVKADGKESKETKITIKLAKSRIQMIVGKERQF